MKSNFKVIDGKLNDFIRKFYLNRIVIGTVMFVLFSLVSFFSVSMVESVAFMTPFTKTILFFFLAFLSLSIFIFFVLIPLLKLLRIISFLTHEEAAGIISNHFPDSKDLLINILQLNGNNNSELLVAAINQKISLISPLNFSNAIDFKKTSRFLLSSLAVLIILITLGSVFNRNFSKGSKRFLDFSTYYVPENPYSIEILNDSLACAYGDDYTFHVKISGPSIIENVYINNSMVNVRMNSDSTDYFSYTFKNLTSDFDFNIKYLDYSSADFKLKVYHHPSISQSVVTVYPPAYTGLDVSVFDNSGDFSVPFGSQIEWNFNVSHATNFEFYIDSVSREVIHVSETLKTNVKALKPFDYFYTAVGEGGLNLNSDLFHVNLVPDYSPQIVAVSAVDSSAANGVFFSGRITDDYGFHSLTFNYFDNNNPKDIKSVSLDLQKNVSQDFYYYFDFSGLSKSVSYYFEVRDNDNISGFKSAKTPLSVYTTITNEEKQDRVDNLNNSIFEKNQSAQRLLNELNNDLNDFQKNVSSNNQISDWEKQLKIDNLKKKQNQLSDLLKDLSQENLSKNAFENQLSKNLSEELLEKQRQMQEMWENLMSDDIKELLDKINEMANSLNEKNLRDNIQDLKFDFNQISEQLDRNNELLKMYNVDNKLHNLSDDLSKMSKDYMEMSKEIMSNKPSAEEPLSDKMSDFNEKFDKLAKDYKDLLKQNEELGDNKLDLKNLEKQFDSLKNELQFQKNEAESLDIDMGFKQENESKDAENKSSSADNKDNDGEKSNENGAENSKDSSGSVEKSVSDLTDSVKNEASDSAEKPENGKDSKDSDSNKHQNGSENTDSDSQQNVENGKNGVEESQKTPSGDKKNNTSNDKNVNNSDKNNQNKASEMQRKESISQQMEKSSEEMEDLSREMNGLKKQDQKKKHTENLNDIRQILDNLITISFNQESLINNLKQNAQTVYMQTDLLRKQNSVIKDFALVQDSIYALAKRTPELGHDVYDKISDIHTQFNLVIKYINELMRNSAMTSQQNVLTKINDLSLLFNEISDNMQKNQQQGSEGEESEESVETKNKKQNQKRQETTQQMKSQQQTLKENLQKMLQQLQNGEKTSAQQMADALRRQEMMMQKLREMQNGGGVSTEEQKIMNQLMQLMEENKRDIVNKNISKRLVDRQNTLFNKLLDLEKAEKSQEFEEERESKQAFDFQNNNSEKLNLKLKDFGVKEFIHSVPLNLDLYYQEKYNNYIQNLD